MFKLLCKVTQLFKGHIQGKEVLLGNLNLYLAIPEKITLVNISGVFYHTTYASFFKYCRTNLGGLKVKGAIFQIQSSNRLLWITLTDAV